MPLVILSRRLPEFRGAEPWACLICPIHSPHAGLGKAVGSPQLVDHTGGVEVGTPLPHFNAEGCDLSDAACILSSSHPGPLEFSQRATPSLALGLGTCCSL